MSQTHSSDRLVPEARGHVDRVRTFSTTETPTAAIGGMATLSIPGYAAKVFVRDVRELGSHPVEPVHSGKNPSASRMLAPSRPQIAVVHGPGKPALFTSSTQGKTRAACFDAQPGLCTYSPSAEARRDQRVPPARQTLALELYELIRRTL